MKKIIIVSIILVALVGGFFIFNNFIYNEKQAVTGSDHKNAEYIIGGERIKLKDGRAETDSAPGSTSKIVTTYFGNEVRKDLNADGREDVVFLLTQQTGGSGTFYYVVASLNTESGYIGSQALLLGDRIAPQTTESGEGSIVVVNYADRAPGEPFTTAPSIGKSIWLKLDPASMQFGEVVQNFEGEADPSKMTLGMKKWEWVKTVFINGTELKPKQAGKFSITFGNDGKFSVSTECNSASGEYKADKNNLTFSNVASTLMFCAESQETEFFAFLENARTYEFTSKGEFIMKLKMSEGQVIFR